MKTETYEGSTRQTECYEWLRWLNMATLILGVQAFITPPGPSHCAVCCALPGCLSPSPPSMSGSHRGYSLRNFMPRSDSNQLAPSSWSKHRGCLRAGGGGPQLFFIFYFLVVLRPGGYVADFQSMHTAEEKKFYWVTFTLKNPALEKLCPRA